jgi:hypothetical protein
MPLPITLGAASARGFGLFSALSAGGTSWIGLLGGVGNDVANSVALDSANNMYVFGYNNSGDFQLAKYSNTGVIQWQQSLSSANFDNGTSVTVDSANNIYIGGTTNYNTVFLAKYNSSGTVQWQRTLSGTIEDVAYGIATDSADNIYIVGETRGSGSDFLIVKCDSSGNIQWQRRLFNSAGTFTDRGLAISTDSLDNVYIGGITSAIVGSTLVFDFQVAKYDSSGIIQWQQRLRDFPLSGNAANAVQGIATDSANNVYACGSSQDLASGFISGVLIKYNSSGTIQWQKKLSGSSSVTLKSITIDNSDNIYVTGYTGVSGTTAVLIAKYYSGGGTLQWQRSLNSSGADYGYSITVDGSSNIYICGQLTVSGTDDFLFAKLPGDGTLTGTYTVGSYSFTYAASSLTESSLNFTASASSLTDSGASLTSSASSLTAATTSLTSTVTTL